MARGFIRRLITGTVLTSFLVSTIGLAETRSLSPAEARAAAWVALQKNRPHITLQIADALAQKSPQDFELALLRAEALRSMQRGSEAVKASKAAWRLADQNGERFDAAHMVAKSYYATGAKTRAQFWLRRASQLAPNEQSKTLAVRDFSHVRARNPLKTSLFFSVFPTSNINNGSTNDTVFVNGLPFRVPTSGQPHSGTGVSLGFDVGYRKPVSERALLRFGVSAQTTQYRLSSAAKALGSGKKGSDFAYSVIEARAGITLFPASKAATGWGASRFDVSVGHSWYGGNDLADFGRLNVSQDYRISKRTLVSFGGGIERQLRRDTPAASATIKTLRLAMAHRFESRHRLQLQAQYSDSKSQSNVVENTQTRVLARFSPVSPISWVKPTFDLGYAITDYDRLSVGGVQRQDKKVTAGVSLFFPEVSYYGFAPTVHLKAQRTDSNISIYSTKDLRMSIGFNSTF